MVQQDESFLHQLVGMQQSIQPEKASGIKSLQNAANREKVLEGTATNHANKLQSQHDSLLNDIADQQDIKNDNAIALKNMKELLEKVRSSNTEIMNGLDSQESTLETSKRLIWYTNQSLNKYKTYDYIISTLLNLFMIVAIISFIYHKKYIHLGVIIFFYLLIKQFL